MAQGTRLLDMFSALTILAAGIYVEIAFTGILSGTWRLTIAIAVMTYVVLQIRRVLRRATEQDYTGR